MQRHSPIAFAVFSLGALMGNGPGSCSDLSTDVHPLQTPTTCESLDEETCLQSSECRPEYRFAEQDVFGPVFVGCFSPVEMPSEIPSEDPHDPERCDPPPPLSCGELTDETACLTRPDCIGLFKGLCDGNEPCLPVHVFQSCIADENVPEDPREPEPFPPSPIAWQESEFTSADVDTECSGASYVSFNDTYQLFVGVRLCTSTRYKIYLGTDLRDTFFEIGDYAGHGQDHCELVDPNFRIPNEDDITSGGCTSCSLPNLNNPVGSIGWSRPAYGMSFSLENPWPEYNLYTVSYYECGVSIP